MAFELYGMLAGNVSPMTGENVKPAYGGEDEAFLRKVVTPIYDVIAQVLQALVFKSLPSLGFVFVPTSIILFADFYCIILTWTLKGSCKEQKWDIKAFAVEEL